MLYTVISIFKVKYAMCFMYEFWNRWLAPSSPSHPVKSIFQRPRLNSVNDEETFYVSSDWVSKISLEN